MTKQYNLGVNESDLLPMETHMQFELQPNSEVSYSLWIHFCFGSIMVGSRGVCLSVHSIWRDTLNNINPTYSVAEPL